MEPKTLTTVGELNTGDRFHFAADKTKKVWQVATKGQEQKTWRHKGIRTILDIVITDDIGMKKYSQPRTAVVFLRHAEVNQQSTLTPAPVPASAK